MEPYDVIIVGAGIAGLVAARELQGAGLRTVVLEKSRGFGGRMATRRVGSVVFDHGAQFFTARDPRFAALVRSMEAAGVSTRWFGGDETATHERHRGVPSMTAPCNWLAGGLDVRGSSQVARVRVGEDSDLEVELEGGVLLLTQRVVLTAPVPQSLALCRAGALPLEPGLVEALESVHYEPTFALMAVLDAPAAGLSAAGFVEPGGDGALVWIADNRLKGTSPDATALTLHASHAFSRKHFDDPTDQVARCLLEAATPWIRGNVIESSLHRWRYAAPVRCLDSLCLGSERAPVLFAGDAFGGAKVEGAALSGWAAAERVLWSLSLR